MRIRTIFAAAAAPAALAAVLLGTTGASAATVQNVVRASAIETHAPDTTDANLTGTALKPTSDGPVWAYDDVIKGVTATHQANGTWDVVVSTTGVYNAFASPLTGQAWKHTGPVTGYVEEVISTAAIPSASHLPKVLPSSYHSSDVVDALFGNPADLVVNSSHYGFLYAGVQGAPAGLYFQNG